MVIGLSREHHFCQNNSMKKEMAGAISNRSSASPVESQQIIKFWTYVSMWWSLVSNLGSILFIANYKILISVIQR